MESNKSLGSFAATLRSLSILIHARWALAAVCTASGNGYEPPSGVATIQNPSI